MSKLVNWLESHWVSPAYSGWLLLGLSVFFFGAASNTMAGWLYVISGTILAVLAIAAVLPERTLRQLTVTRHPISSIYAGQPIVVELTITNHGGHAKDLLQVSDQLPYILSDPQITVVETIAPGKSHRWLYTHLAARRGVYSWKHVQLRTAAPLGLFWCRRNHIANAQAVVYPQVLRLNRCPILDEMGDTPHVHVEQYARSNQSYEGFTRALRPYRWGDPIRLIHWRTSARYGELRVRELEILTGGEAIVIALDLMASWTDDEFEQAVIAAATLYDYGDRNGMDVSLWTVSSGVVRSRPSVLMALANVHLNETPTSEIPQNFPIVWLTTALPTNPLISKTQHHRVMCWTTTSYDQSDSSIHSIQDVSSPNASSPNTVTLTIDSTQDLASQLQQEP